MKLAGHWQKNYNRVSRCQTGVKNTYKSVSEVFFKNNLESMRIQFDQGTYQRLSQSNLQYTKNQDFKKQLSFGLICVAYFEDIVTKTFVQQYTNLLTLYVQYTKTQAAKKQLLLRLICAVYLENIVTISFVPPCPNLLNFYVQYTKNQTVTKLLSIELSLYVQYNQNTQLSITLSNHTQIC